jgi:hypothetical protein
LKFTTSQISSLIRAIFDGKINVLKLPKKLYNGIAEHLTGGIYKGYGKSLSEVQYDTPDYNMLHSLKTNVYLFSSAKTFNYVLATENLIVEGNEVLPFKEFKKRALEVYDQYNVTWLESEYNTAIGQAQSARAWNDFSDDAILRYVLTAGVEHHEACLSMEGVQRPKNDPIWITNSPLNGFNCLCSLVASYDNKPKPLPSGIIKPPPEFAHNSGMTGEAFSKEHPYFDVPDKYKKFAKKNFGLPIPE